MAADAPVYTAECLCKACAVTLRGNPGWAVYCHCSQCRRALGSDYATLVGGAVDAITPVRGEFKSFSTGKEERYSCPTCFSTVWADLHHLNARAIYNSAFVQPNHGPDGAITPAWTLPSACACACACARGSALARELARVLEAASADDARPQRSCAPCPLLPPAQYSSGITRVSDALPKFEGLPTAFGGTGVELNNDGSKK